MRLWNVLRPWSYIKCVAMRRHDCMTEQSAKFKNSLVGSIVFYASVFRRRRHHVFGLSVHLSVRPSVRSLKLSVFTRAWFRWSIRPTVNVLWHVRPSVRLSVSPSEEVSGHLPENVWREWSEILHVDVSWAPSELNRLWSWSVDFPDFGVTLT